MNNDSACRNQMGFPFPWCHVIYLKARRSLSRYLLLDSVHQCPLRLIRVLDSTRPGGLPGPRLVNCGVGTGFHLMCLQSGRFLRSHILSFRADKSISGVRIDPFTTREETDSHEISIQSHYRRTSGQSADFLVTECGS